MAANGRLSSSSLTTVQGTMKLSTKTARAYKRMVAAHPQIHIAGTTAGAYRSYAMQADMHVHPSRYGLNPNSSVPIAAAGYSSHGYGTAVDLVGDSITDLINIAAKYGFTRQFGAADPNHFIHDGVTAVSVPKTIKRPGHIDYTLKSGKPNSTFYKNLQWYARQGGGYDGAIDGKLGVFSWKGVQTHLHKDGLYNGDIDGKPGKLTYTGLQKLGARHKDSYNGPFNGKLNAAAYEALSVALNLVP